MNYHNEWGIKVIYITKMKFYQFAQGKILNMYRPVCVRICRANSSDLAKRFPHDVHEQGNGRSPVKQLRFSVQKKSKSRCLKVIFIMINILVIQGSLVMV